MLTVHKCPNCNSPNHSALAEAQHLLKCFDCGHVFQREVPERSPVAALPGYHIEDDEMPQRFRTEIERVATVEDLDAFLEKWQPVWRLESNYLNDTILDGSFDKEEALRCISTSFGGGCAHVEQGACVGMMIALPPPFLRAMLAAEQYGVPFCTALHQLYCTGDNHDECF